MKIVTRIDEKPTEGVYGWGAGNPHGTQFMMNSKDSADEEDAIIDEGASKAEMTQPDERDEEREPPSFIIGKGDLRDSISISDEKADERNQLKARTIYLQTVRHKTNGKSPFREQNEEILETNQQKKSNSIIANLYKIDARSKHYLFH